MSDTDDLRIDTRDKVIRLSKHIEFDLARDTQIKVRSQEIDNIEDYENERVKQSIVHAREDIVLLVSYASSIIEILKSIRTLIVTILVFFVIYLFFNLMT